MSAPEGKPGPLHPCDHLHGVLWGGKGLLWALSALRQHCALGIILKCQCAQEAKSSRSPAFTMPLAWISPPWGLPASLPAPRPASPLPAQTSGPARQPLASRPSDTPHTPSWGWFTHPVSSLHRLLPGKSASLCLSPGTARLVCPPRPCTSAPSPHCRTRPLLLPR